MGKKVADSVLNAALNKIATATQMIVCANEPADRAAAVAAALATAALTGGDFAIADGDVSGRKVTVGQKTGINITADGTAGHIVLIDGAEILYVTTCANQALTSGNTMTVNSWKVELLDPTP